MGLKIDVSTLIEDVGLDISQLPTLKCGSRSAQEGRSTVVATFGFPVRNLYLTDAGPGVYGVCENEMLHCLLLSPKFIHPAFKHPCLRLGPRGLDHRTIVP